MENKEEEKVRVLPEETRNTSNIFVDIEKGTTYDMNKDFQQVGKASLYYVMLQFIVAFIVSFIVIMVVTTRMMSNTNGAFLTNDMLEVAIKWVSVASALSAFISGALAVRRARKKLSIDKTVLYAKNPYPIGVILKYTVIAMGFSTIAGFIVMALSMIASVFGVQFTTPDFSLSNNLMSNIFMLLAALVAAPIFEELLCRGIILRTLQRYNTRFAILVSSIVFGLLHMNIIQGLPAFAMGLVLAYVSVKSNSIIPSILMHFINNAFAMFATTLLGSNAFFDVGFLVIEILMMLFAVYYIVSHRLLFLQDEDLNASGKGYYKAFFNSWPNVILIAICSIITIISYTVL